nr:hypothetical protein [Actinomadura geliboluensis]
MLPGAGSGWQRGVAPGAADLLHDRGVGLRVLVQRAGGLPAEEEKVADSVLAAGGADGMHEVRAQVLQVDGECRAHRVSAFNGLDRLHREDFGGERAFPEAGGREVGRVAVALADCVDSDLVRVGVPDSGAEAEAGRQGHGRNHVDARGTVGQPFCDQSRRDGLVREGVDALLRPRVSLGELEMGLHRDRAGLLAVLDGSVLQ